MTRRFAPRSIKRNLGQRLTARWIAWFALVFALGTHLFAVEGRRPNILLIIADDLGYGDPGCYGGKDLPTPHIDRLAAEGVRFTNGYVTAPFCAASRAGLLTGRYQTRFGFEFNPIGAKNADPQIGLPVAERTLADRLRAVGYATTLVGKWHLGGTAAYNPLRRGYDEFFGFLHEGHTYVPPPYSAVTSWWRRVALPDGGKGRWTSPDGRTIWSTHMGHNEPDYDADNPILRGSEPVVENANLTDAFTREACHFIDRHRSQPFFLTLAYNAVHSPMQGMDAYMAKFASIPDIQRRLFLAMLANLDDSIAKVRAQLVASGIEENTLIFFISDNGAPTKELASSNAPLRGGKMELYEGGIRVPFIMTWKGRLPAGRTVDASIISLDIAATSLAVAGAPEPASADGVNLLPLITRGTEAPPHETLFWRVGLKNALRQGDWKLIRDPRTRPDWQLYNLSSDIGETDNLADRQPDKVRELAQRWDRWNTEQVEARWK